MTVNPGLIEPHPSTSFARLSPMQAWLVLGVLLVAIVLGIAVTQSSLKSGYADTAERRASDVELYNAEVRRIQAGEGYYDAAAAELRQRGYPTRIATAPDPTGQASDSTYEVIAVTTP